MLFYREEQSGQAGGSTDGKSQNSNDLLTKQEEDDNGDTHYYVGEQSSDGSVNWREVDALPMENEDEKKPSGSSQKNAEDDPCEYEYSGALGNAIQVGFQQNSVELAEALRKGVESLPCGVFIEDIDCFPWRGCSITFKDAYGNVYGGEVDNKDLGGFYKTLSEEVESNRFVHDLDVRSAAENRRIRLLRTWPRIFCNQQPNESDRFEDG